jgi:hypothetical protein
MGLKFNQDRSAAAFAENDYVFGAVSRLHARGFQVAREVHLLLSNGFADGAEARWRTLHEIAVTASFIKNNGQDVAESYLCHSEIEAYKSALIHQDHYQTLRMEPISEEHLNELKCNYDLLLNKYGKHFKNDYGWASSVVGKRKPNFLDIEKNAGLEHVRPYVYSAHTNVHAMSHGILYRLGLGPNTDMLLAGPSIYGLSDPGRFAAFSAMILNASFLLLKPDLDNVITIRTLQYFQQETYHAFEDAETAMESHNHVGMDSDNLLEE